MKRAPTPELEPGRFCYYIRENQDPAAWGGYVPDLVVEHDPYLYPMLGNGPGAAPWVWGPSLPDARATADEMNARLGLDARRVAQIIASSMGASVRRTDRRRVVQR